MNNSPLKWYQALHKRGTVVYLDDYAKVLAVWNGSLTINWYYVTDSGGFYPTECTTMQGDDRGHATLEEALEDARDRMAEWAAESSLD